MPAGRLPLVIAFFAAALIGGLAAVAWLVPTQRPAAPGPMAQNAAIGGPFTLVDVNGRTVTDADFRGRYMLIYFGYAYCPDVCPMSLARNAAALDLLGEKADRIQPILITVDPERDTPQVLEGYVEAFHPRLIALTGTPEQIAAAAKAYRVYYAKAQSDGAAEDYLVDHSSFTYLMGPDGKFLQFFRHEISAEQMAERLKSAL